MESSAGRDHDSDNSRSAKRSKLGHSSTDQDQANIYDSAFVPSLITTRENSAEVSKEPGQPAVTTILAQEKPSTISTPIDWTSGNTGPTAARLTVPEPGKRESDNIAADPLPQTILKDEEQPPQANTDNESLPPGYFKNRTCRDFAEGDIIKLLVICEAGDKTLTAKSKGVVKFKGALFVTKERPYIIAQVFPHSMVVVPVYSNQRKGCTDESIMYRSNIFDRFDYFRLQLMKNNEASSASNNGRKRKRLYDETLPESRVLECVWSARWFPLQDASVHLDIMTISPRQAIKKESRLSQASRDKLIEWLNIWHWSARWGKDEAYHAWRMRDEIAKTFKDNHEAWWDWSEQLRLNTRPGTTGTPGLGTSKSIGVVEKYGITRAGATLATPHPQTQHPGPGGTGPRDSRLAQPRPPSPPPQQRNRDPTSTGNSVSRNGVRDTKPLRKNRREGDLAQTHLSSGTSQQREGEYGQTLPIRGARNQSRR